MKTYRPVFAAHAWKLHRAQERVHHVALPRFRPGLGFVPVQAVLGPAADQLGAQASHRRSVRIVGRALKWLLFFDNS